jgi:formate hydrogenlyase subunit 4
MSILSIFINVLVFFLLAPLFEGIVRKINAKVQSRIGPPIIQPYYDILKLLGKENFSAGNIIFSVAPLFAFASILSVIAFMPLGYRTNRISQYVDIITIIYLLTAGGVAVLLGAISSKNTYAVIGSSREMITMIMIEPVLAISLIMSVLRAKSLNIDLSIFSIVPAGYGIAVVIMLIVYLLALQAFVGKQPFDIAEAEVEILEGPFIEYSGPNYALFKYYLMLKQMFYAFLFVSIFIPFIQTGFYIIDILIQLLEITVIFIIIALIGSINPRFRIDQAVRYYAVLIIISLVAIGLSIYGM